MQFFSIVYEITMTVDANLVNQPTSIKIHLKNLNVICCQGACVMQNTVIVKRLHGKSKYVALQKWKKEISYPFNYIALCQTMQIYELTVCSKIEINMFWHFHANDICLSYFYLPL